jgi:hypothetical protein
MRSSAVTPVAFVIVEREYLKCGVGVVTYIDVVTCRVDRRQQYRWPEPEKWTNDGYPSKLHFNHALSLGISARASSLDQRTLRLRCAG